MHNPHDDDVERQYQLTETTECERKAEPKTSSADNDQLINQLINESEVGPDDFKPTEIVKDTASPEDPHHHRPCYVLPAIVISQFAGTALWFAGNAVLPELVEEWDLPESSLSFLTSSVQFGFIVGTLIFALLNLADRYPPTKVFLCSALGGASCNALIPFWKHIVGLVLWRFLTGVCLAGIYPVGMKVAADWYKGGTLGSALGWLVGALSVGSAFPFLLRQIPQPYEALLWETSALCAGGGLLIGFGIQNGPYRKPGTRWDPSIVWTLFQSLPFRSAAFGYFSHMWELYAFWTWCPVVWEAYLNEHDSSSWDPNLITFSIIAVGGVGCVVGGILSIRYGSGMIAFWSLAVSGSLCCLSPLLYRIPIIPLTLCFYLIWGMTVVADSPQFSSLVAQTAPAQNKGTALTIVNCMGFAITIGSIQLLGIPQVPEQYLFVLLAPGPMLGLWFMRHACFGTIIPNDENDVGGDDITKKKKGQDTTNAETTKSTTTSEQEGERAKNETSTSHTRSLLVGAY